MKLFVQEADVSLTKGAAPLQGGAVNKENRSLTLAPVSGDVFYPNQSPKRLRGAANEAAVVCRGMQHATPLTPLMAWESLECRTSRAYASAEV